MFNCSNVRVFKCEIDTKLAIEFRCKMHTQNSIQSVARQLAHKSATRTRRKHAQTGWRFAAPVATQRARFQAGQTGRLKSSDRTRRDETRQDTKRNATNCCVALAFVASRTADLLDLLDLQANYVAQASLASLVSCQTNKLRVANRFRLLAKSQANSI